MKLVVHVLQDRYHGRRDCVFKRNAEGKRVEIQSRLVLVNLREAFAMFKEAHPDVKIGFSKFCAFDQSSALLSAQPMESTMFVCVNITRT